MCVVGKWRVICKMESGDAEIGMSNGCRAVWVVRLSAGTKHERARWDLAERRRRGGGRT